MAKQIEQLTDLKLRQLRAPGRYADGQGLYGQVTASKKVSGQFNRSWLVRVHVPVSISWPMLGGCKARMRLVGWTPASAVRVQLIARRGRQTLCRGKSYGYGDCKDFGRARKRMR